MQQEILVVDNYSPKEAGGDYLGLLFKRSLWYNKGNPFLCLFLYDDSILSLNSPLEYPSSCQGNNYRKNQKHAKIVLIVLTVMQPKTIIERPIHHL
jgi:hypothetical protein